MTTKIRKWGNSLAVRVPKVFAQNLNWKNDTHIYFQQIGNTLIISSRRPKYTLEELLKDVTRKNRHKEIDWGPPRGKEIW